MKLQIIAVGHKMPAWITQGFDEYAKRMPAELRIELREIKPERRSPGRGASSITAAECARIETVLAKGARVIALDEHGRDWTTLQLAEALLGWQRDHCDIAFVIGGADGLAPAIKSRADLLLRLSSFTLPHGMVRVLLAEQLYRAWSITQNHPYHRA